MSFLSNAKELAEAKEKISSLESQLAQHVAKISELTEACSVANKAAEQMDSELAALKTVGTKANARIVELEGSLTAEQTAHAATKASVENLASQKAQQILASAGHKPVEVKTEASNGIDFLDRMAAEPDPVKRAQLWEQNKKQAKAAFIPVKRN